MLDRAGNAGCDVEIRCDDLAGLADLPIVGSIARPAIVSIEAEPPSDAEAKLAVRTVITFFASVDGTVWIALPA
jgi:hypothetical protein